VPDFDAFLRELERTLRMKSARRGTANIGGPADVLNRLRDKLARLEGDQGFGGGDDDWLDAAGYSGIGWLLAQGKWDDRGTRRRVYLANGEEGGPMATEARYHLQNCGFSVFHPRSAFWSAKGQTDWVWETNLAALSRSDLVVAIMPHEPAVGVASEMVVAKLWRIPVWVYTLDSKLYTSTTLQWAASRMFLDYNVLMEAIKEAGHDAVPQATATSTTT
jgi:hypothetical protein